MRLPFQHRSPLAPQTFKITLTLHTAPHCSASPRRVLCNFFRCLLLLLQSARFKVTLSASFFFSDNLFFHYFFNTFALLSFTSPSNPTTYFHIQSAEDTFAKYVHLPVERNIRDEYKIVLCQVVLGGSVIVFIPTRCRRNRAPRSFTFAAQEKNISLFVSLLSEYQHSLC